jgi:hypothetical protein
VSLKQLVIHIDREIARFREALELLGDVPARGTRAKATPKPGKRRTLSPEDRKRISEGMKRRWAERRKTPKSAK